MDTITNKICSFKQLYKRFIYKLYLILYLIIIFIMEDYAFFVFVIIKLKLLVFCLQVHVVVGTLFNNLIKNYYIKSLYIFSRSI